MSEITSAKNSCDIAPVSIPALLLKCTFNTPVGGDFLWPAFAIMQLSLQRVHSVVKQEKILACDLLFLTGFLQFGLCLPQQW